MDLSADEVPHFFDYPTSQGGQPGIDALNKWLEERGIYLLEFPFTADNLTDVLDWIATYSGETYYMLVAESKSGENHCVVCHKNKIVHDPTYGVNHGIIGPAKDGYWWAGWLTILNEQKQ